MPDLRIPMRVVGAVDTELDGRRLVIRPSDLQYFEFEGSGAAVWDHIDGVRTVEDIIAALEDDHPLPDDTAPRVIRDQTIEFLRSLAGLGLVDLVPET